MMQLLYTAILIFIIAAQVNAQSLCFYDPNTGGLFNNGSSGAMYDVTAGDFNKDGNLDIVTANSTGGNISFIPGKGDGTLGKADTFFVPGVIRVICSGDFNKDGNLDVAAGNSDINIFLGNGDGSFQPYVPLPGGNSPNRLIAMDINNDGNIDIVQGAMNGVFVLKGNGSGGFSTQSYSVGGSVMDVTVADFTNDNILDIITVTHINWVTSKLSLLKGTGGGNFAPEVAIAVPHYGIFGIASADMDFDGEMDLIVSNHNSSVSRVEIYSGNGDGTFKAPLFVPAMLNPIYVYIEDMDNDNFEDIVVSEGSGFTVIRAKGDVTFYPYQNVVASPAPTNLAIGDFNGDGMPDVAVPSSYWGLGTIGMQVNCTPTGIGDTYSAGYPKAFPNPASDFIQVSFEYPKGSEELVYILYDVTGRMISTNRINISNRQSIQFELDIRELPKGIYLLEVRDGAEITGSIKIMKN